MEKIDQNHSSNVLSRQMTFLIGGPKTLGFPLVINPSEGDNNWVLQDQENCRSAFHYNNMKAFQLNANHQNSSLTQGRGINPGPTEQILTCPWGGGPC